MLDGMAYLPARRNGFYHVNSWCRAIPANQGEISRENMATFFRKKHLPVLSAEQNDSQSEEMNQARACAGS